MSQFKINDLTLASSITSNMQLETDISGTTANKVNINQLTTYMSDNITVSQSLDDLTDVTITTPQSGNILYTSNGTTWSNIAPGATSGVQAYNANTSFVNVAETRSASINMADNVLQRPEIKDYSETSVNVNATSTTTLDLELGNIFNLAQSLDITILNINNPSPSGKACSFTLIRTKDNSATARAISWPASVKWHNGVAPTLSSTANAVDIFEFFTIDAGTTWFGFIAGQAMA